MIYLGYSKINLTFYFFVHTFFERVSFNIKLARVGGKVEL
jgi:hypothetical protein